MLQYHQVMTVYEAELKHFQTALQKTPMNISQGLPLEECFQSVKHGKRKSFRQFLGQHGFLRTNPSTDQVFVSVPSLGRYVAALIRGRKEICHLFKRKGRYLEMFQRELATYKLRTSQLPMAYHRIDLLGAEYLMATSMPGGILLKWNPSRSLITSSQ